MRIIFTLFLSSILSMHVAAQRLATEDFNYTAGALTDLNGGANVSGGAWANSSGNAKPLQVIGNTLSYTDYFTSPLPGSGKLITDTVKNSGEDAYMSFAAQNSNTVYCSLLISIYNTDNLISHDSANGDYFVALLPETNTFSYAGRLYIRNGSATNTFNLGIAAQSAANTPVSWLPSDYPITITHLITLGYEFVTGSGNDVAKLWVDYPFSTTEPAPQASSAYAGGSENNNIARLAIRQNYSSESKGGTPKTDIDAIKISTSWSDVSLPVTLLSFMASLQNNRPVLNWKTTNEINLKEYVVERSSDAKTFHDVSAVKAKNRTGTNDYTYTDAAALQGQTWYRLRITNMDGSYTYSSIQQASVKNILRLELKNNPVKNEVAIIYSPADENSSILIINAGGTIVRTQRLQPGSSATTVNVSALAGGAYHLLYQTGSGKATVQFIKE